VMWNSCGDFPRCVAIAAVIAATIVGEGPPPVGEAGLAFALGTGGSS